MEIKQANTYNHNRILIHILWDASPLWGHLVLNAIIQTGLPYSLVRAQDLHATTNKDCSVLSGKILIVPGGFGRVKSQVLGEKGKNAIRDFVAQGGVYIGFCGGAGLGLTDIKIFTDDKMPADNKIFADKKIQKGGKRENVGLGLCPWGRGLYANRLQHLVSGHISSTLGKDVLIPNQTEVSLPVWWPGRMQEPDTSTLQNQEHHKTKETRTNSNTEITYTQGEVRVLARYKDIGDDLYVADLPLKRLPPTAFEDWKNLYGVHLRPNLLDNEPAIIAGDFGQGQYVLSYSHLETPNSPSANELFAHILRVCLKDFAKDFSQKPTELHNELAHKLPKNSPKNLSKNLSGTLPVTHNNIFNTPYTPLWLNTAEHAKNTFENRPEKNKSEKILNVSSLLQTNKNIPLSSIHTKPILFELFTKLEELFQLGVDLRLLFPRTEWLYGWHTSVPGSQLNALRVALLQSVYIEPGPAITKYFQETGLSFCEKMLIFINGAKTWLLARKLSEVSEKENNNQTTVSPSILKEQRKELFGLHMAGGGLCGELIDWLNELLFCTE